MTSDFSKTTKKTTGKKIIPMTIFEMEKQGSGYVANIIFHRKCVFFHLVKEENTEKEE